MQSACRYNSNFVRYRSKPIIDNISVLNGNRWSDSSSGRYGLRAVSFLESNSSCPYLSQSLLQVGCSIVRSLSLYIYIYLVPCIVILGWRDPIRWNCMQIFFTAKLSAYSCILLDLFNHFLFVVCRPTTNRQQRLYLRHVLQWTYYFGSWSQE